MRKPRISFFAALGISVFLGLCQFVIAQDKKGETDACDEVYQEYRKIFQAQNQAKKYELAKAFLERFPNSECGWGHWTSGARKFIANHELRQIYNKCQEADKSYFASPNADTLNKAIVACDFWINRVPKPEVYDTTRLALATGYGVLAGFYKDTDRSFDYAERALKLLAPEKPPEGWKPEDWQSFRRANISRLLQYQGLFKLRQERPDAEAAIVYLTKATEAKEGPTFKDPNTYLLRAEAYTLTYSTLRDKYSDPISAHVHSQRVLEKVFLITEKMIEDYARVVVLTENKSEYEPAYNNARAELETFAKFRGKPVVELIDRYKNEFGIK